MSATIETIISCDGNSPACTGNDWSADQRYKSAAEQREVARRELGWRCVRGKDYCPKCWEVLKRQLANTPITDRPGSRSQQRKDDNGD